MVKFVLQKETPQGRVGKILTWGTKQIEHFTPSAMIYLRGGHIPHLTWDVSEKYLKKDQVPIYQLTLPSLADSADIIKKYAKGVSKFCGIPENSVVHLAVHDPLSEFKSGFNDHKSVAIWTTSGKICLDVKRFREIISSFNCDSFETLFDYDLPRNVTYKRLSKAVDRTQTFYEQLLEQDHAIEGNVLVSLGGGFSDFYRRKCAVDIGKKTLCDGFNIDLHDFTMGNTCEEEELQKLLSETFEPINPNKIRFVAGPFDPKAVALLVRLGIDFFDTSFPVKMTEEGKAFKVNDSYPENTDYVVIDFNDEKYNDQFVTLFSDCECYTCKNYTLGYLHHLNNTKELLLSILLMIHNVTEFQRMFSLLRKHLLRS